MLLTGSSGSQFIREKIYKGNKLIVKSWTRTPCLNSLISQFIQKKISLSSFSALNQEAKSAPDSMLESFQFTTVELEQSRKATCSSKQWRFGWRKWSLFVTRCPSKSCMAVFCIGDEELNQNQRVSLIALEHTVRPIS